MLKLNAVLNYKEHSHRESKCAVGKVVELSEAEFADLQHNLLKDRDFIRDNIGTMRRDQSGVHHCLLALGEGSDNGILIYSEGTNYARCSAPLPNARSLLQQQSMSPALKELNAKLEDVVRSAEYSVRRQLEQSDEVKLSRAEVGVQHGVDLERSSALVDTVSAMLREELDDLGLQMEMDKSDFVFTPTPRLEQDMQPGM